MKLINIRLLEKIKDVNNDNVDVLVEKEDGTYYIVTVGTPQDLLEKMNQEKTDFIEPGNPTIIVKKLTNEIIREALEAYAEDSGYWLRLYHFSDSIDLYVLDKLEAEYKEKRKKFDLLNNLSELQDDINKLEQLDKSEKSKLVNRLEKLADELFKG